MSVSTSILFLNANDPGFLRALNGTPEERREWEDNWGPIEDRPGATIDCDEAVECTDDEYGGWIISLDKLPEGTTHVVVYRG